MGERTPLLADVLRTKKSEQEWSTEDWIRYFQAGKDSGAALLNVMAKRKTDPTNLNLRDADHALDTAHYLETQGGPSLMDFSRAALPRIRDVIGYSSLKALMQTYPWLRPFLTPIAMKGAGHDLTQSTPPDFKEVYWGLAPLLGRMPK